MRALSAIGALTAPLVRGWRGQRPWQGWGVALGEREVERCAQLRSVTADVVLLSPPAFSSCDRPHPRKDGPSTPEGVSYKRHCRRVPALHAVFLRWLPAPLDQCSDERVEVFVRNNCGAIPLCA